MSNQWEYIIIEEAECLSNWRNQPLVFDCHFCGMAERGHYTVTRKSRLSGIVYVDYACRLCKQKWDIYCEDTSAG